MALDHRLPVEELHVITAILHPFQRVLTKVHEYLIEHDKTAVGILNETTLALIHRTKMKYQKKLKYNMITR